jgi:hypothetical protein
MVGSWPEGLLAFFKVSSEILAAGVVITAFSLMLFIMAFNLRERVTQSFALILLCVVIVYASDAIGSITNRPEDIELWLRLQWVGVILLPAGYIQFSHALLATTGESKGYRGFAMFVVYLVSVVCLFSLPTYSLVGPLILDKPPAPYLSPTLGTTIFTLYYAVILGVSWFNFRLAFKRTTTVASRRRMTYFIISALAPPLGAFPFLLFGSEVASRHELIFWGMSVFLNLMVGVMLVVMAHSAAFFGTPWPDRVVRTRLFKWIMRGPFTASLTLAVTTLIRRATDALGYGYTALVPLGMVGTIVLCEYLITILAPLAERWFFYANDREEVMALRQLENRLLTRGDLKQFLEMILAAVCDRLQVSGAYLAAINPEGLELVVSVGKTRFSNTEIEMDTSKELIALVSEDELLPDVYHWESDYLIPLRDHSTTESGELMGLMGISTSNPLDLSEGQIDALEILTHRVIMALRDRRLQQKVFQSLESLKPQMDMIQRMRAAGQYDREAVLSENNFTPPAEDLIYWVKEALTHYWGGPKLVDSPLLRLNIVQQALTQHNGNTSNALRAILREAIERVRPEGERRFTVEWILYNILELKFIEGKKVREVALRLAMSEADLYRKQRVAIEVVAKAIIDMEEQARDGGQVEQAQSLIAK